MRARDNPTEQADDGIQLYRVHQKYDIVETEIRLLHKGDFLNFQVRPFLRDSTKVIMWVSGIDEKKEFILQNKNYQGSL